MSVEALRRDAVYALKALRQSPGFTAAAVVSLALGIGANTAIFSIFNSLLLKPLPVRNPGQLVAIASDDSDQDAPLTYPIWREIRDRGLFNGAFVWASDQVNLVDGVQRTPLETMWVDGNFFNALGIASRSGRLLTPGDDRRGGGSEGPVAVLSHAFWKRRFGGDAAAIGQPLNIEGTSFHIAGVTPPEFYGLEVGRSVDIILPLETEPLLGRVPVRLTSQVWPWLHVGGRLERGEAIESVTTRLRSAQPQIRAATMPAYTRAELREAYLARPWTLRYAGNGSSRLRSRYGQAVATLLAIVGFVLLIACANLATLQLARTSARRYEFSVRSALGASRRRIVQQQLVESGLLALAGALLGALLAQWGSRVVVAQLSNWATTVFLDLSPDWRVLVVTTSLTALTTILFGAVPAARAAAADPLDALKANAAAGGPRHGFAAAVVIAQISLSFVLVAAAVLFLRSFANLAYRDLGFARDRVLVAVVQMDRNRIRDQARMADEVRQAAAAVPGVDGTAVSMASPLGNAGLRFTRDVFVPGRSTAPNVFTVPVSPGWFHTYGTRVLLGRDFAAGDVRGSAGVAIVNESFVRRYLGDAGAVGRDVVMQPQDSDRELVEIVGVVADAAFTSVRDRIEPTIYRPFAQFVNAELLEASSAVCLSIRTQDGVHAEALRQSLSTAIERVDASVAVSFLPLSRYLDAYYTRERLLAMLSGFFGSLGLLLAAVGLYGVTGHFVTQRQREIAVRMALGARAQEIMRVVIRRFTLLAASGAAVGAMLAWWAARLVRTLLYGVDAHDAATFGGAVIMILAVAVLASWIPARRAARLNMAHLLRS